MYIPKCFHEQVRKEYLIKRLKEIYNKDNKETQAEQLPQDAVSDSFIIEVAKNNRLFFIGEIYELTWKKENALKFKTIEEAENEIKNNRFLELITKNNYKVINYIDAVSH